MRSGLIIAAALLMVAPALAQFPEDFEAGVPPTGWAAVDLLPGTPFNWTVNVEPNETGGTGICAEANSDAYGETAFDVALVTPEFGVPAGGLLEYDTAYENFANYDVADVDISVDSGSSWINLGTGMKTTPVPSTCRSMLLPTLARPRRFASAISTMIPPHGTGIGRLTTST